MISNETAAGLTAALAGYLLGSLPSAYLLTRWATGKDIRKLGGGNVGGLNTFRQAGTLPGIVVLLLDVGKGTGAVAFAYSVLGLTDLSRPWVLIAGFMAVVGHNWMVWLRFSGGRGLATLIGALSFLYPIYGYCPGVAIFLGPTALLLAITRNIALSSAIGMLSLPVTAWLGARSALLVAWSVVTGLTMGLKYLPTARAAWVQAARKSDFFFDRKGRKRQASGRSTKH